MAENVKCYCPICKQHTHHQVMAEHLYEGDDDEYFWRQTYRMVKCCGCEHVSFDIETFEESNVRYDDDGNMTFYPEHLSYPDQEGKLKPIETSWDFPDSVLKIYKETVKAINNECYTLAAAGFRAVIESICLDKKINGKNLELKINNMQKAGIITLADRDRFHSVRFLGNDSVHEIKTPERRTLLSVLEIIEGILKNLYVYEGIISSELERPIKTIEEFIVLLNEGLKDKTVGTTDVLRNLLPQNRRLIREDMSKYEQALIDLIDNGKYDKLSLCPPPSQGRHQQYKVEIV